MYTLKELKNNRDIWKNLEMIPILCDWCHQEFEIRYGTLYNIIRRNADGVYCSRKHAGAARAKITQDKYIKDGGKVCKRCGEFKKLDHFWPLPNPPYYRSECKRCRNYKPARRYSFYKSSASTKGIEFSLTLDQFLLFWDSNCVYCDSLVNGISLELKTKTTGYTVDNCISCCNRCRKFRGELDHQDFLDLCKLIVDTHSEVKV